MFKKNSDNSQSRATRQVIHGRYNEHGIDPTAFSDHAHPNDLPIDPAIDRVKLRRDKVEIEHQLSLVNARLIEGRTALKRGGMRETSFDQVSQWERQRNNLIRKLGSMNKLLMQAKMDRAVEQAQESAQKIVVNDFPRLFMGLAKELLAHEVYERIFIAAVHRQHEQNLK